MTNLFSPGGSLYLVGGDGGAGGSTGTGGQGGSLTRVTYSGSYAGGALAFAAGNGGSAAIGAASGALVTCKILGGDAEGPVTIAWGNGGMSSGECGCRRRRDHRRHIHLRCSA